MAYDEYLEERVNNVLNERHVQFDARKMMGGLIYVVDEKMCFGIVKDELMVRVGIDAYPELIEREREGARSMDFTKRPMNGFFYVAPEGFDFESDLEFWIQKALDFNPFAVATKSKKKKK
ncbi:MAG: TfoX/Sxy family protein [Crocinitomicaceae bacterium]|nr:TfoX/Sxy family protein [Crocinitomicaceae bacterium]